MNRAAHLLGIGMILLSGGLTACEGPTGPQGPEGPEGPQGPQGPEGTANVQYSPWIEFSASNWSATFSYFGQTRRAYPIGEPDITQDIVDSGIVRVFVSFLATDEVEPLPVILRITGAESDDQLLDYQLKPDSLRIYMHNLTATGEDPGTFGSGNFYRYVIIPGGVALSDASVVDLNDYGEITAYFGIDP